MTDWMQPQSGNTPNQKVNVTTNVNVGEAPAAAASAASAPSHASAAAGAPAPAVMDIGTAEFGTEVIEASHNQVVLIDFWAPWCGPCKQLGPIMEKAVTATKGAVRLVKMDIDKHPEVSNQMGIQSIPAVVAFIDGRPADAFMGAKPESEVKAFIDKQLAAKPGPQSDGPDLAAAQAQADELFAAGDHAGAAEIYAAILGHEPGDLDAIAGLGQCYVAVGEMEQARGMLASVPQEHHDKPPLAALVTTLDLAAKADALGDVGELAAAVEANPKNHQARFDYALALNANGKREEAADQLIEIVRADRTWNDDGARAQLLEFFESWGNADPATLAGRRSLSSVLFS